MKETIDDKIFKLEMKILKMKNELTELKLKKLGYDKNK